MLARGKNVVCVHTTCVLVNFQYAWGRTELDMFLSGSHDFERYQLGVHMLGEGGLRGEASLRAAMNNIVALDAFSILVCAQICLCPTIDVCATYVAIPACVYACICVLYRMCYDVCAMMRVHLLHSHTLLTWECVFACIYMCAHALMHTYIGTRANHQKDLRSSVWMGCRLLLLGPRRREQVQPQQPEQARREVYVCDV